MDYDARRLHTIKPRSPLFSDVFSIKGQKIRSIHVMSVLILKCWPTVRLLVREIGRSEVDPNLLMLRVEFGNGLVSPLTIDTLLEGVVIENVASLDAIIVVERPSIDDVIWCERNKVALELSRPQIT